MGSGNTVHTLGKAGLEGDCPSSAMAFDEQIKGMILVGNHLLIMHYSQLVEVACLSVPTDEHFLPPL